MGPKVQEAGARQTQEHPLQEKLPRQLKHALHPPMGRAIVWRPFAEGMLDRIFFHACVQGSHLGSQPTRMHARWVLKTLEHIKDDQTTRGSKGKSPPIKGREFARHDQKILKKEN